jgi:phosphate transport system permease protein
VLPLFFFIRRAKGTWEWKLIIIFVLSVGSAYVLSILPEYLYGFQINGIIHHSFVSALVLLGISIPSFCYALYYLLGATPKAYDLSHYPIIVIPVFLMLAAYAILIYRVFALGVPHLSWHILTTPFVWQDWQQEVWQNGWPQWVSQSIHQAGLSNYILGTLLLIAMTSLISLPIGMGVGIYITEYSTGVLSKIIKFSCNALRSISVFILGLIAFALVRYTSGTFLSTIFAGYFYDLSGNRHIANGSFVTASIVISLLVIPIIARATEEGIRSIPQEMKEGSLALGASREHTLRHILIPWTLPNTVTGLLLGCAEASGSLATIWFIAGTGQYGVGPFNQVTSLSYFIYFARGDIDMNFKQVEGSYQFTAALILILITIGLSVAAVMLKRRFSKRYKVA